MKPADSPVLDITFGVSDLARACRFYDAIFAVLGFARNTPDDDGWAGWGPDYGDGVSFSICKPFNGAPATVGNGTMVTLRASSDDIVRKFHGAALANGGTDEGAPGTRDRYSPSFYVAYVRDPDGNKLACVFNEYVKDR
jgi:catechol 2,3-dioxygenase-like lactoylglutathione lyase family enzyme